MARFDSFRTVEVAETIEAAIGKTITDVRVDTTSALAIDLVLDDGSSFSLVQRPTEPDPSGRSRL